MAIALLEQLYYTPIASINDIQNSLEVSHQTAAHLLKQFAELGIVQETTGQKRMKRYVYQKYLDILAEGTQPLSK